MIFHVTNITVFTHYEKDLDIYFVRFYKTDTHENWISPFTKEELELFSISFSTSIPLIPISNNQCIACEETGRNSYEISIYKDKSLLLMEKEPSFSFEISKPLSTIFQSNLCSTIQ